MKNFTHAQKQRAWQQLIADSTTIKIYLMSSSALYFFFTANPGHQVISAPPASGSVSENIDIVYITVICIFSPL